MEATICVNCKHHERSDGNSVCAHPGRALHFELDPVTGGTRFDGMTPGGDKPYCWSVNIDGQCGTYESMEQK